MRCGGHGYLSPGGPKEVARILQGLDLDSARVLEPGGWFAASDWLISHDAPSSPEMARYIELGGLDFAMASPARYEAALKGAGFVNVSLVDRNPWYTELSRREVDFLTGGSRAPVAFGCGGSRRPR